MDHYEQLEFDVMLDSERDLKENVGVALDFACRQMEAQNLATVASRQEGYGIAMEYHNHLARAVKSANEATKGFLAILPAEDNDAIFAASKLYDAAADISYQAVRLAAQANRIRNDLYKKGSEMEPEKTPLEEYAESIGEDFEEAEQEE